MKRLITVTKLFMKIPSLKSLSREIEKVLKLGGMYLNKSR